MIVVLVVACGTSSPTPPPPEPHTGFAPLELSLPVGPDWLAASAGSLWVKRDDGFVSRIDPETGAVLADVKVNITDTQPCNGLGVSADAVWSCSYQDLVRIDPSTNEVTQTVPTGKILSQGRLVEAAHRIWVLSGSGDALVGVATSDGSAGTPFKLPVICSDLGVAGDVVYAVCPDADTVLRFDPASGAVMATVSVPDPTQVSATDAAVWVAAADGLRRLDPTSLATQLTVAGLVPGFYGGILAAPTVVWVRTEEPFLTRVDAATGSQTQIISAPFGPGDVLVDGDRVWATDVEGNILLRLTIP
jgi:outer membrane protein assembly factor BamB